MAGLNSNGRSSASLARPVAIAFVCAIVLLTLAGAWVLWSAGGRSSADAAIVEWVDPLLKRIVTLERDVADTDRHLRLFVLQGRPADATAFEARLARARASAAELRAVASHGGNEASAAADELVASAGRWLGFAEEWYHAARSAPEDAGRRTVLARMGPEDPLASLARPRERLEGIANGARESFLAASSAAVSGRATRGAIGLGLLLVAIALAVALAISATRGVRGTGDQLDLGLVRSVFDQIPDAVAVFDDGGRVVVASLAAARAVETTEGASSRLVLYDADQNPVQDADSPLGRALSGQHVHGEEYYVQRIDGSLVPVEVQAEPILDKGRATAAVVVLRDTEERRRLTSETRAASERAASSESRVAQLVTQLREVESRLGETESARETLELTAKAGSGRFDRLLQSASAVGVALFDAGSLQLRRTNLHALAMFGERRREREVEGSTLLEIVPGAEQSGLADLFRKVVASGEPFSSEEYYAQGLRHDAAYWRFSLIPVAGDAGTNELLFVGVDITQDVELRKARAESPRNTWKIDEVLTAVANDLKTPVHSIRGMVELFRQKYAEAVPDVTALHYLELTQRNAEQIATLIDDLDGLSSLGTSETRLTEFPLAAAVEEAWRASHHAGIELRIAGPLPTVRADHTKLVRALGSLFESAARFRREGPGAFMYIAANDLGDQWEIELTDNGRGFDPEEAEALFGPLSRGVGGAHGNGAPTLVASGLGLAAVRRVAELHGGDATVTATQGEGAKYTLTLDK